MILYKKNFIIIPLLILFYYFSYSGLLAERRVHYSERLSGKGGLEKLPSKVLLAISGEFKGIIADYLTLEAGARTGTSLIRIGDNQYAVENTTIDWNSIVELYKASQTLDPSFQQTYILAQGLLPWQAGPGLVEETQSILQTAATGRKWDWQPVRLQAFNTYYFLKNPGEAGKIFLQASKYPNAPSYLAILGARLAQKGNETAAAIILMKSMLANKSDSDTGYQDITDRLHALMGTLIVEKGVTKYYNQNNKFPQNVTELVNTGILQKQPENPYNLIYCIDETGKVYFDKLNCRQSNAP